MKIEISILKAGDSRSREGCLEVDDLLLERTRLSELDHVMNELHLLVKDMLELKEPCDEG